MEIESIEDARNNLEKLDNLLELLISEYDYYFNKTQPGAIDFDREIVSGGKREDKFLKYIIKVDEKELKEKIKEVYLRRERYESYINKELSRMCTFNEVEKAILYYRDIEKVIDKKTKKKRQMMWVEIAEQKNVCFSPDHCRRIYRNAKKKEGVK